MASQYSCYVPKEWNVYPKQYLISTIQNKAETQWKHYKNLQGTTIRLTDVTAKLNYYRFRPWLRKADDENDYPQAGQYVEIEMKCILCSKSCRTFGSRCCVYT